MIVPNGVLLPPRSPCCVHGLSDPLRRFSETYGWAHTSGRAAAAAKGTQGASKKHTEKASFAARMATAKAQRAATPSPIVEDQEYNAVQVEAHNRLSQEVRKRERERSHTPPARLEFESTAEPREPEGYEEATGCRLVDLDLFHEYMTRLLPCPQCMTASLFCRAEDEHKHRAGLGGYLPFWCSAPSVRK
jgi:hypothetical protein